MQEDEEEDEIIEDEELGEGVMGIYDVEKILDKKKMGGVWKYLVKWEGWDNPGDLTWEPIEHLTSVPKILERFEDEYSKKAQKRQELINNQIIRSRERREKDREMRKSKNCILKKEEEDVSFELDEGDINLSAEELEKKYIPGFF